MPLTNVIQNPGLGISNATVGSYTMWNLYKSSAELQAEAANNGELLFLWTNCTSPLSYKGTGEITSVADIKGNIRGNNGPAQTFINEVGASVFGCAIGDVYTNVTTGIINYLITDWHGIKSFSLADEGVLNYYVDTNIGCSAYALMANSDIWASIDPELQDAIKSVSGDYLLNLVSIWDYWEAAGRYVAVSNGGIIFEPSDTLAAELATAYDNVAATWISEQADTAVAQSLYDQAKALVEQYNAEFDW
jgi:TRAP-type C4-dicarboxylate transport system substrate-binding protein